MSTLNLTRYVAGLLNVYGGNRQRVLLTVRRAPNSVLDMRSFEMTPAEARELAAALNEAADHASRRAS